MMYLPLLAALLLQGSRGVTGDRSESQDDMVYSYGDPEVDLTELNRTIIECCNTTRIQVLQNVHNLSSIMQAKLGGLANKEDVTNLQNDLDKLATKVAMSDIQGKLEELPSKDNIRNYTEVLSDRFTTQIGKLGDSANNLISNGTKQLLDKLNTLSTFEDIKNLTEIVGSLATKEGLNSTKTTLTMSLEDVQENVQELNKNLTKLARKEDIGNITDLVQSLATKESLESFEEKLKSLSKEQSVNNLTNFVSSKIADKTDIEQTKEKITTSTSEIKKELSTLREKLSGLAANANLQSLNTKVVEIDEKINKTRETVSELKNMLQTLQKTQEDQKNILQKLADKVGKPGSSQDLENVESLVKSLQTTSTSTLQAVQNIANTGQSATNCVDSSDFRQKINGLRNKVENKCSYDGIQTNLEEMEERIRNRLDNITFCNKTDGVSPKATIPEAGTCEDSVFINPPNGLNLCYAVVTKRLCNTDPLIAFHCCQSCVFANQISSHGKHLYMKAPRKIHYDKVLSFIFSEKNY